MQNAATGLWWNGAAFAASAQTFLAASGTTSWTFALPSSALTSGSGYRVTATATDGTGNVGVSAVTTFVFDNTPPVVVIGYPVSGDAYGPNWSGAIGGTVADPDANLTGVSLTIADSTAGTWWNGADWQSTAASVSATGTTAWSYPLASSQLTDDHRYAVVAVATDAVGNIGISTTSSFRVDVAAVSVAIGYPVTTAAYGGNWTGTVAGTAADSHPNLAGVSLTIADTTAATTWTGSAWSDTPSTVTADGTTAWSYPLASTQLTSGHALHGDRTGDGRRREHRHQHRGDLDVQQHRPDQRHHLTGHRDRVRRELGRDPCRCDRGRGAGLTVARVALSIENTSAATYWTGTSWTTTATSVLADGTGTWSYPLPSTALTSGATYTVRATVTDDLGNATTTAVTWTYSTTPPAVAITSPVAGTSYGANWTGTITGTAGAAATSVTVSVQNSTTGLWWNGTAFSDYLGDPATRFRQHFLDVPTRRIGPEHGQQLRRRSERHRRGGQRRQQRRHDVRLHHHRAHRRHQLPRHRYDLRCGLVRHHRRDRHGRRRVDRGERPADHPEHQRRNVLDRQRMVRDPRPR